MIIYIKELENEKLTFLEKIKVKLKLILVRKLDMNRKILILPNIEDKKKFVKLNNKLKKAFNCKIVLAKSLKKYENEIECSKILRGKLVQKSLIYRILKLAVGNFKTQDVYILCKRYEMVIAKMSEYFADKVRTLNIVTNEIAKYKKLEDKIYNEKGIIITVSNNKKKSLKRAKVIINIDLNNEEINKYNICRNSVIINLSDEKIHKLTAFDGIIINNVQIDFDDNIRDIFIKHNLYGSFENSELYESIVGEDVDISKIRLKELIGNNGIINFHELYSIRDF